MARKYLSREGYLAEGARLLKKVIQYDTAESKAKYAAWLDKAQPTMGERIAVVRLAHPYSDR